MIRIFLSLSFGKTSLGHTSVLRQVIKMSRSTFVPRKLAQMVFLLELNDIASSALDSRSNFGYHFISFRSGFGLH